MRECSSLKRLELHQTPGVGLEAFEFIADAFVGVAGTTAASKSSATLEHLRVSGVPSIVMGEEEEEEHTDKARIRSKLEAHVKDCRFG